MNRVLFNIDKEVLDQIHTHSLEILKETGIRFPNRQALEIFKHHGFKIDGEMVFFQEKDIEKALELA